MLDVEERYMIRELHRQGVSISEIARRTGCDRKTVRHIVAGPLLTEAKPRKQRQRKIDAYIPYLEQRIEAGVLNAHKLYQEICSQGYAGKATQVRSFVQPYRQRRHNQATVRFETEPGQQAQVDWGHFGFIHHQGRRRRLYVFVMTLGWSRAMYMEFTVSANIAWWLRCHLHAFDYLGGVCGEMLHDNLKTAVVSHAANGIVRWNSRYLDFAEYCGFRPRACQPYRPQTKGKVESGIRYVRGNFWPGLRYRDLTDLNQQALVWLNTVANVRIHGTTGEVPLHRLPHEQLHSLQGRPEYDTSLILYRRSSRDCLISYEGNYYSVPATYAAQRLLVKVTPADEVCVFSPAGELVAIHPLTEGRNLRVMTTAHYADIVHHRPAPRAEAKQLATPETQVWLWPEAPRVEERPLSVYQQYVEAGR